MEWIKLSKKKPLVVGIYNTLSISYCGDIEERHYLYSDKFGFQPLDYGRVGSYGVDLYVTHWLDIDFIERPIKEAKEQIVYHKHVFGNSIEIQKFMIEHGVIVESIGEGSVSIFMNGVSDEVEKEMKARFSCNGRLAISKLSIKGDYGLFND
jgi:hypothetical protein